MESKKWTKKIELGKLTERRDSNGNVYFEGKLSGAVLSSGSHRPIHVTMTKDSAGGKTYSVFFTESFSRVNLANKVPKSKRSKYAVIP